MILDDSKQGHDAARTLVALGAALNPTGDRNLTISLAVQQLIAPLRLDMENPSEILVGVAKAAGVLTAFAQPNPVTGELMIAILNEVLRKAYRQTAAEIRAQDAG